MLRSIEPQPLVPGATRAVAPAVSERKPELRSITAALSATPASLARLLRVTGAQSDFVLVSVDGSISVRVKLSVASVPDAELLIGRSGAVLDWSRSTVSFRGNRVTLSRMELRLLLALLECAPHPATKEELAGKLWGADAARRAGQTGEAALPVWVCALRRRLASVGLTDVIATVRNTGYALTCA